MEQGVVVREGFTDIFFFFLGERSRRVVCRERHGGMGGPESERPCIPA